MSYRRTERLPHTVSFISNIEMCGDLGEHLSLNSYCISNGWKLFKGRSLILWFLSINGRGKRDVTYKRIYQRRASLFTHATLGILYNNYFSACPSSSVIRIGWQLAAVDMQIRSMFVALELIGNNMALALNSLNNAPIEAKYHFKLLNHSLHR